MMSPGYRDPRRELERNRLLLVQVKRRFEGMPDRRLPESLLTLIRGLMREVAWWGSHQKKAQRQ